MRDEYEHIVSLRDRVDAHLQATGQAVPPLDIDLPPPAVRLLNAADVKPEPVSWLWPDWLARGKLHILGGRPGSGKTTISMALAATVSIGGRWPDGTHAEAGDVVIWSGEDDPADTLVPRLLAAGADLRRVHFVREVQTGHEARPFDPATDVPLLAQELERIRPALLIVDPIVSAVAADSHKNGEVRRALQPLVDMAGRVGCAVLGITHLSKNTTGRDPTERITGSIAFAALARVVLLAAKREQRSETDAPRLLARGKSNIGPDEGGIGYDLEQAEAAAGIWASRVAWCGVVDGSARELLAEAEAASSEEAEESRDAAAWLQDALIDGPKQAHEVRKLGDEAGFPWRTLQRAARRIGVNVRRAGFGKGSTWSLEAAPIRATSAPFAPFAPHSVCDTNGTNEGFSGANGAGESASDAVVVEL